MQKHIFTGYGKDFFQKCLEVVVLFQVFADDNKECATLFPKFSR